MATPAMCAWLNTHKTSPITEVLAEQRFLVPGVHRRRNEVIITAIGYAVEFYFADISTQGQR